MVLNGLNGSNQRSGFGVARDIFANMHVATIVPFSTLIGAPGDSGKLPGTSGNAMFIAKVLAYNAIISTVQAAHPMLEALVAEGLFIAGKMWYYKFLLNPTNVTFTHNKLQSIEETSDITIINTYRNAATTLSFKGVSGCTMPRDFMALTNKDGLDDSLPINTMRRYPKLSSAWLKFRQLEKFYNETNSDIIMMYDLDLYVGKFVNFSYSMDAQNPWIINYDMSFKLYPQLALHTTSAYDYSPFFNAMTERYGRSFAQDFEGKSKASKAGK